MTFPRITWPLMALAFLSIASWAKAKPPTPVAAQGETIISASHQDGDTNIQATIRTHKVDIGKRRGPSLDEFCAQLPLPQSVVDQIDILVNEKSLQVPLSVFSDLANVGTAQVWAGYEGGVLNLHGGDAACSYRVQVDFNPSQVLRRVVWHGEINDVPLEETIYFVQPVLVDMEGQ